VLVELTSCRKCSISYPSSETNKHVSYLLFFCFDDDRSVRHYDYTILGRELLDSLDMFTNHKLNISGSLLTLVTSISEKKFDSILIVTHPHTCIQVLLLWCLQ